MCHQQKRIHVKAVTEKNRYTQRQMTHSLFYLCMCLCDFYFLFYRNNSNKSSCFFLSSQYTTSIVADTHTNVHSNASQTHLSSFISHVFMRCCVSVFCFFIHLTGMEELFLQRKISVYSSVHYTL